MGQHYSAVDDSTGPAALAKGSGLPASQQVQEKLDSTRVALAALAGWELRRLADGGWLASRWNRAIELADGPEVDAWLAKIGGER